MWFVVAATCLAGIQDSSHFVDVRWHFHHRLVWACWWSLRRTPSVLSLLPYEFHRLGIVFGFVFGRCSDLRRRVILGVFIATKDFPGSKANRGQNDHRNEDKPYMCEAALLLPVHIHIINHKQFVRNFSLILF